MLNFPREINGGFAELIAREMATADRLPLPTPVPAIPGARDIDTHGTTVIAVKYKDGLINVADRRATKPEIRQAVQELFKVKVTRVNTLNVRGKARRKRTAQAGTTSAWKKAIVTLKDGDKIVLT